MAELVLPTALLSVAPQVLTALVVTLLALAGRRQRIQRHRPGVWVQVRPARPVARREAAPAPEGT